MAWTEDRVNMLKKLWSEGYSASQIAKALGETTRNAVIGKVHRLGIAERVATPKLQTKKVQQEKSAVTRAPAKPVKAKPRKAPLVHRNENQILRPEQSETVPTRMELWAERPISLLELTLHTCRWPVGDPAHDDFHFCGGKVTTSDVYCDVHKKVAYQPARKRKPRDGQMYPMTKQRFV